MVAAEVVAGLGQRVEALFEGGWIDEQRVAALVEGKVTDLLADTVEDLDEAALLRPSKLEALSRSFPNDRLFASQLLRKLPRSS